MTTLSTMSLSSIELSQFLNLRRRTIAEIKHLFIKYRLLTPIEKIYSYTYEDLIALLDDLNLFEKCGELERPYVIQEWYDRFNKASYLNR